MRLTTRYDYQITPSVLEKSSAYYAILKGHFSYWEDQSVTAFILNILLLSDKSKAEEKET